MGTEPEHEAFRCGWEKESPTFLISTLAKTRLAICSCPHAMTLEAYSKTFRCTVWIPLECKQWKCRWCSEQKIKRLARRTEEAKPNRLLTLTVDPKLWENPRASFDGTRRKVSELTKKLRDRFGEVEYLRVTELTRNGWPHYHLLVRSDYIPHSVAKSLWEGLTGATIVDLRRVKNKHDTFFYLVKYLSKLHSLGWTDRHVSYSRGFFPKKEEKADNGLDLAECTVLETHPGTLFYHQFRGATIHALGFNVFALNAGEDARDQVEYSQDAVVLTEGSEACSTENSDEKSVNYSQKKFDPSFSGSTH